MANNCATCHYHGKCDGRICCDYLLMTGKIRPCPAGKGCTVKIPKSSNKKKTNEW